MNIQIIFTITNINCILKLYKTKGKYMKYTRLKQYSHEKFTKFLLKYLKIFLKLFKNSQKYLKIYYKSKRIFKNLF